MAGDASDGFLSQEDIDSALTSAASGVGVAPSAGAGEQPAAPAEPAGETRVDSAGRPFDAVAAAMAAAIESEAAARSASKESVATLPAGAAPFELSEIDSVTQRSAASQAIDLLRDVQLHVKIELGRSKMLVDDVLRLGEGSVVELDKLAGDPVDVFVNDRLVARGEVLVLNDNFCVRINDIVRQEAEESGQN